MVDLDLDPDSRKALEFDELLARVAACARTPLGAARVAALRPSADATRVLRRLSAVGEARRYAAEHGPLLPAGLPDPAPALRALAVAGRRVETVALRDLAAVCMAAGDLRARLRPLGDEAFPELRGLGREIPDLRAEARPVLAHTEPDGRLADDASPELRRLRIAGARLGERLRKMLERRVREPEAAHEIRDDFVTQRNGRFVVPLRADAPGPVRGIVHATSSSGATLFVEPLDSVPLNNERVALAEAAAEEEERILVAWADRFRLRRAEAAAAVEAITRADALEARARFAERCGAIQPRIDDHRPLRLARVRHPLLEPALAEKGGRCVPLNLELAPGERVLVLSGPNTGGKTVALKTLGLSVLMAQSGIPLPAGDACLPLYRQVRADIGDHQSIRSDLSTFSAHLQAVGRFLGGLRVPALVLFDEIGTGTEPSEGAALARAVLEAFLESGATTVATTHHGALKSWAVTTGGVACAAMEFDRDTLRPTYRVLSGITGISAGLEIAARHGVPADLVARARAHLGEGGASADAYLERLRELLAEQEQRAEALARREREAEAWERREAERRRREDEARRREADAGLERALERFRKLARREAERLFEPEHRARAERRVRRVEGRLQEAAARARSEAAPAAGDSHAAMDAGPLPPEAIAAGMRVHVRPLAREGEVVAVRGRRIEVRLGRMTVAVAAGELGRPRAGAPEPTRRARPPGGSALGGVIVESAAPPPSLELKLIGRTVDEALPEVDRYLDGSALAGHTEVRVVHGHGSGRLRTAVRGFLEGHPHVAAWRPGRAGEGGDGATVVTLR